MPLNLFELTLQQKQLVGSIFGSANPRRDIPRLLRLYMEGKLKLDELVTRTYPLADINQGYQDMRDGKNIRGMLATDAHSLEARACTTRMGAPGRAKGARVDLRHGTDGAGGRRGGRRRRGARRGRVAGRRGLDRRDVRRLLTGAWELDPMVALRPEPFGALAYHYGNRRLTFLRSPDLVTVVRSLGDHDSVDAALAASDVAPPSRGALERGARIARGLRGDPSSCLARSSRS